MDPRALCGCFFYQEEFPHIYLYKFFSAAVYCHTSGIFEKYIYISKAPSWVHSALTTVRRSTELYELDLEQSWAKSIHLTQIICPSGEVLK